MMTHLKNRLFEWLGWIPVSVHRLEISRLNQDWTDRMVDVIDDHTKDLREFHAMMALGRVSNG